MSILYVCSIYLTIYIHTRFSVHITHIHAQPSKRSHILFGDSLHLQNRPPGPIGRLSSVLEGMHKEPAGCYFSYFKMNNFFLGWVDTSQNHVLISCSMPFQTGLHPEKCEDVSVGCLPSYPTLVTFAFMLQMTFWDTVQSHEQWVSQWLLMLQNCISGVHFPKTHIENVELVGHIGKWHEIG